MGRRVFVSASAADVSVEGQIEKNSPTGWRATLQVSDDHGKVLGTRELETQSADCRELDQTLPLVIAVLIDPDAPPPGAMAPIDASAAAHSNRWQLAPELGLATTIGELPQFAWGPTARVRFGPPAFGIELFGTFLVPQDVGIAGSAAASVHWTWAYGGAALCPVLARPSSSFVLAACAGFAAGALDARPTSGVQGAQETTSFLVMGTLGMQAEWRFFSKLFLAADLRADIPVQRPRWSAATADGGTLSLFSPSPVSGTASLALGVSIE